MKAPFSGLNRQTTAIPLPQVLKRHGYLFRQLERSAGWAIYAQCYSTGGIVAYEAIRVRIRPETRIAGKALPKREVYPSDERWGRDGWTYSTFGGRVSEADALAQARERVATLSKPKPQGSERARRSRRHGVRIQRSFCPPYRSVR